MGINDTRHTIPPHFLSPRFLTTANCHIITPSHYHTNKLRFSPTSQRNDILFAMVFLRPASHSLTDKLSSSPFAARLRFFLPSSLRALTTAREQVKVLLVLYDGGQHAKDVSSLCPFPCMFHHPTWFVAGLHSNLRQKCGEARVECGGR